MTAPNLAPKVSVVDQLAKLGVKPEQIKYVGISHYHADHTGQVASFPQATLLIGKGDWDAITAPKPAAGVNAPPFAHWISGGGKVEPLPWTRTCSVTARSIILNTPGHTPGHHSLLVKLKEKGNVLITGDLVHFHENYNSNGVPWFNIRPRGYPGFDRPLQEARGEFQSHRHHSARRARHRQIAGVPRRREIVLHVRECPHVAESRHSRMTAFDPERRSRVDESYGLLSASKDAAGDEDAAQVVDSDTCAGVAQWQSN